MTRKSNRTVVRAAIGAVVAVAALLVLYTVGNGPAPASAHGTDARFQYEVGKPGPGEVAPPIRLASTHGEFNLGALRGQSVLLYFQEGIMCQACWDQLREIEANWSRFTALGVDRIVQVTTDPVDASRQKLAQEGLSTPTAYDPDVSVSRTYETNKYGMMGDSMNGHSFVLVDASGVIRWRADYGGAPKYTMYIPVTVLLDDLKQGLGGSAL